MDLKFYPFDLQVCPIHVESYAYREDQLNIEWHSNYSIEISTDLTLPTFSLVSNLIRHWLGFDFVIEVENYQPKSEKTAPENT